MLRSGKGELHSSTEVHATIDYTVRYRAAVGLHQQGKRGRSVPTTCVIMSPYMHAIENHRHVDCGSSSACPAYVSIRSRTKYI